MFSFFKQSPRLKICATVLAIAALLSGGWFCCSESASGLAHRFVPGQRLVYELEFLTASTSNFMGLLEEENTGAKKRQGLTNTAHTNLEGELIATVLETTGDGALL